MSNMSSLTSDTIDLYDLFNTNRESEEDGVWVSLNEKTGFKIRAAGAKVVSDLREKLMKPFQTILRAGLEIPPEKNEEIGLKVVSHAILSDWRGVVIKGEEVPYSPEAAYTLLKELPKLSGFIASNAMESSNFREQKREADSGN